MGVSIRALHPWAVNAAEGRRLQQTLRQQLCLKTPRGFRPRSVAGVDAGIVDGGRTIRAAVVVMALPDLTVITQSVARAPAIMPYIPGLLSFRELPGVVRALEQLDVTPDLLLCDGQGIAHPRRLGIAAHLGLITDLPAIGVGKSRLVGTYREPRPEKGATSGLYDGHERIGTVLRSRDHIRPLYVSPGHRISHEDAVHWVLACCTRYRLPEPQRAADRLASAKEAPA